MLGEVSGKVKPNLDEIVAHLRVRNDLVQDFEVSGIAINLEPKEEGSDILTFTSEGEPVSCVATPKFYMKILGKHQMPGNFVLANPPYERKRLWDIWVRTSERKFQLRTETHDNVRYATTMFSARKHVPTPFEIFGLVDTFLTLSDSSWNKTGLDIREEFESPVCWMRFTHDEDLKLEKDSINCKGVEILYSDVDEVLDIERMIWRKICTNGMFGWAHTPFFRHKAFKDEISPDIFKPLVDKALEDFNPPVALLGTGLNEKIRQDFVLHLLNSKGVSKKSIQKMLQSGTHVNFLTLFDLVNFFTQESQKLPNFSHRKAVETACGSFLRNMSEAEAA